MKTVFDKVYCITLEENVERQNNIKHILNDIYNIDFEFIYAFPFYKSVYSGLFDNDKVIPFGNYDYNGNVYIDYDNGRSLSIYIANYCAAVNTYKQGINRLLIIEDDICLYKDVNLVEKYFNEIPEDADVIRYGYNICFDEDKVNYIKSTNTDYWQDNENQQDKSGAQMFALMNRNTIKIYYENIARTLTGGDNPYNTFINNEYNLNIYYSTQNLALDHITYEYIINNETPPMGYYPFDVETIKKNINNYFKNE